MKKNIKKHSQHRFTHIAIIVTGVIFFLCLFFLTRQTLTKLNAQQSLQCPSPAPGQQGLQLQPCYPVTGTVAPTTLPTIVPRPTTRPSKTITCNGTTVTYTGSGKISCCSGPCCGRGKMSKKDKESCDSKPVINLYPTKDTNVSVKITIPGVITESIPEYPVNTGWQHIWAHPNGTFEYQNHTYSELFYETAQDAVVAPKNGFVVKKQDIAKKLTDVTTKLGFLPAEQKELLDYWVARLTSLQNPYVFISVFSLKEKQAIDNVVISPKPDTFIQYIFYFKGMNTFTPVTPLPLPATIPQRNGFTVFEWGGIEEQ